MTTSDEDVRRAIAAVRASYGQVVAAIESVSDHQLAFELATELRDALDALVGDAADLRAQMVGRIWAAEELSLAALANRIGVSKSRAGQFINTARTAVKTEKGEP